ncbi:hypothetical protein ACFQS5_24695 [Salinirubellus sp. GCM10025899]|uniref:hypothetical protein n=1 Tax=Salinirubellus sp. GCM10025899 TaxID=3252689 RepID=UPI00361F5DC9
MRRTVLEHLATASDADRRDTTTVGTLALVLDAGRHEVETHLYGLAACELARIYPRGRVRVTVTGEEFLNLETEGAALVDPSPTSLNE